MTKIPDKPDVRLQGCVIAIGKALCEAGSSRKASPRSGPTNADALDEGIRRALKAVRTSPARRYFGIKANFEDKDDAQKLKAIAAIAWQMIGESSPSTYVEYVAKAIIDLRGEPFEELLLARDLLGRMVCDRLLNLDTSHGDPWSGRLISVD